MRLLWLPTVLRAAGLTVVEVPGWQTRSAKEDPDASTYRPGGLICHETRGSATSSDAGEIGVLVNGRVGLSGPIAQTYIGRDGRWHVVAAGLCHHVKTGWGGPFSGRGNTRLFGVEPAHSVDEDWADKPVQYASYVRGVAAILRHTGWPPPVGHKEHQPGDKPDPEFNMVKFRREVAAVLAGEDIDMATPQEFWAADVIPSGDPENPNWGAAWALGELLRRAARAEAYAKVAAGQDVDEQAVAAAILAVLTPQAIAAAVPAELAREVVDELTARLAA